MKLKYCFKIALYLYNFELFSQTNTHIEFELPQPLMVHTYLTGKIEDGRYYGYKNFFSVEVPSYASPQHIEDEYLEATVGGVAFYNSEGYLLKIEFDELLPEVKSIILKHPHIKHEVLDAMVHEAIVPQLKKETRDLKVLHQRNITLQNNEPALFVVLNLPGEASVVERSTGRNLDSMRGYLYFFSNNNQLISFAMQDSYSLSPRFSELAKTFLNERLLEHLLEVQRTFKTKDKF